MAKGVSVTSLMYALVSESPHFGNLNGKDFSSKLVAKCLLSLMLELCSHSVDCLYETFFPGPTKYMQMFAIDGLNVCYVNFWDTITASKMLRCV